jgi:hypothetical protein
MSRPACETGYIKSAIVFLLFAVHKTCSDWFSIVPSVCRTNSSANPFVGNLQFGPHYCGRAVRKTNGTDRKSNSTASSRL